MPAIHAFFQNIPSTACVDHELDTVLLRATELFERFPPATVMGKIDPPLSLPTDSIMLIDSAMDVPSRVTKLMAERCEQRIQRKRQLIQSTDGGDAKTTPAGSGDSKSTPVNGGAPAPTVSAVASASGGGSSGGSGSGSGGESEKAWIHSDGSYELFHFESRYWRDRERNAIEREQNRISSLVKAHTTAMKKKAAATGIAKANSVQTPTPTVSTPPSALTDSKSAPATNVPAVGTTTTGGAEVKTPPPSTDQKSPPAVADGKTPDAAAEEIKRIAAAATTALSSMFSGLLAQVVEVTPTTTTTTPTLATELTRSADAQPISTATAHSPSASDSTSPKPVDPPSGRTDENEIPGLDAASIEAVKATPKTAREIEQERMRKEIDIEQWNNARRRLYVSLHHTSLVLAHRNKLMGWCVVSRYCVMCLGYRFYQSAVTRHHHSFVTNRIRPL